MSEVESGLLVSFAPFAKWSPHFETDLELIQAHLDSGGRAVVLSCRGELPTCELNPTHEPVICRLCRSRFESGMGWLRGDVTERSFLSLDADERTFIKQLQLREWASLDEVRDFRIDGADIGLAAVSSLVSMLRESAPDVREHRDALSRHLGTAATVYFSMRRQLSDLAPDTFVLFNARYSALRPALRAARSLDIRTVVHERAGYQDRYQASVNTSPHDLSEFKRDIEAAWPLGGLDAAGERAAHRWFEERRQGVEQNWKSFIRDQRSDLLPEGLDRERLSVTIFNSSEDEFVAIEEWKNQFYASQNAGIDRLLSDFAGDERVHFYLRIHPNLGGLSNSQTREIEAMADRYANLTVIPAESPVSTYSLMGASKIVLSYGSTAGVEACYSGTPAILMGRATYEDLGLCLKPDSHEALVALLRAAAAGEPIHAPTDTELGLLKFGHYFRVKGTPYRYVRPAGLFAAQMVRDGRATSIEARWGRRMAYKWFCLMRLLRNLLAARRP